ncbi:hypothetical protein F8388_015878 [Cannabis sativa]|uniref:Uncharacterized protein n=1 Tax=Cannabis sativa TaxID=3483 RepID=A0A7J6FW60_CANSA|nr:hypothetical protein F8388_015878 [Cannabis sativa]
MATTSSPRSLITIDLIHTHLGGGGGGQSRDEGEDASIPSSSTGGGGGSGSKSKRKKRYRTKFTAVQKEKMLELSERIGWRIQKHDESAVEQFSLDTGVSRHVLKIDDDHLDMVEERGGSKGNYSTDIVRNKHA